MAIPEKKIQQIYPIVQSEVSLETIYSFSALNFPTEGVALAEAGPRRPYVYFNMVSSADGKIATAEGSAAGLGSRLDKLMMRRLRAAADAVIVGAETFRRDPFVPRVSPELADERAKYFPDEPQPWGIVLSRDGKLPLDKKFFETPERRIVALGEAASREAEAALSSRARVVRVPLIEEQPDLQWLMAYLYAELGIRGLLCEGGPSLNSSLLEKGLGDELFMTFAPRLIGGQGGGILAGPHAFPANNSPQLELISLYEQANELFFRYKIAIVNRG